MSHYGNDFTRKGVDKQQYQESGLADTKSFREFQTDRRAEARSKIENSAKGGEYYKTSSGGKQYLARDPNTDQAEWNKNYFASLGIEDDGHDRGDGNPGSWGDEAHNAAVRAANQGITITQEDRRLAYGNEADFDMGPNTDGVSSADRQAAEEERKKAEEQERIEAKQRSQEFQAKASSLRNQFAEGRKSYRNNTFTDAQNVNNSTNNARSALPEKFDVRAASQYGNVKRWNAENSNPSYSNI